MPIASLIRFCAQAAVALTVGCSVFAVGAEPVVAGSAPPADAGQGWTPLFNGTDLTGWETWLGTPAGAKEPLGLNNDPRRVFTVEDGALHISGEVFGALSTLAVYGNYHLRLQQKWGDKRWPPREQAIRDSGICYHGTGRHGAFGGHWMSSIECQVQEGEIGDTFLLAGPKVDVHGEAGDFLDAASGKQMRGLLYRPEAPSAAANGTRIVRGQTADKPRGEWNTIEVICTGDTCTHIVNGVTAMVMSNPRHVVDGATIPLVAGHIQLQSEGAEVWYRAIELKPLAP